MHRRIAAKRVDMVPVGGGRLAGVRALAARRGQAPCLSQAQQDCALPGLRVLVVDDDAAVAETLAEGFETCGCDVRVLLDPREGLRLDADWRCELLVTDLEMPGMSGFELAFRLRLARPWLPVLLVTGSMQVMPLSVDQMDHEITRMLRKPFPVGTMLANAAALVCRHARHRAPDCALRA